MPRRQCLVVLIIDDDISENTDSFRFLLEQQERFILVFDGIEINPTETEITINPAETEITIMDDDGD